MDTLIRWLLIVALIYLAGGAALFFLQRLFLYFPRGYTTVPGVSEVTLHNEGVRLHGYLANEGQEHLLLYFGGNAEQVASGIAQLATYLPAVTVVGFDYRGYGKSGGRPSEQALYDDALYLYEQYAPHYPRVSLLGRSLGSAVVTYVASRRKPDSLVLVTPIDSVARIATSRYGFYPVDWLLKDRFDSLARAHRIEAPVLMLTAADDTLVPPARLQALKEAFTAPVEWISIEGVGHNTIQNSPSFGSSIRRFLMARQAEEGGAEPRRKESP